MLNLTGTESANEGNSDHELRFETMNNKIRRKKLISNKWGKITQSIYSHLKPLL